MKKIFSVIAFLGLILAVANPMASQVTVEDCLFPYLENATDCDGGLFSDTVESPDDVKDLNMFVVVRIEYMSEKDADKAFDEITKMYDELHEDSDEIPLEPTKDYKRIGIGDALQGEDEDGMKLAILRDDKAIIMVVGDDKDGLFYDLVEAVVEEDAIPGKVGDLEKWEE